MVLENLISEHHRLYLRIFDDTLKPKHHIIILHYPTIIKKCGPVKYFWCMRYKSKNKEIITYTNATSSRRNLSLSISKKCSVKFAYTLLSLKQYSELIILKQVQDRIDNKIYYHHLQTLSLESFSVASQINYKGTNYKINQFLLKDFRVVYKILDFIISNNVCLVMLQEFLLSERDEHFMCFFVIKDTKRIISLEIKEFYKPISVHTLANGQQVVKRRYL